MSTTENVTPKKEPTVASTIMNSTGQVSMVTGTFFLPARLYISLSI